MLTATDEVNQTAETPIYITITLYSKFNVAEYKYKNPPAFLKPIDPISIMKGDEKLIIYM